MCGIAGFTGKKDNDALKRMTDSIFHRGPDDDGLIIDKNFNIGFRRLSIIDLSENIYPVKNEDGNIQVVLNGEIYNYEELKLILKNKGHKFKTKSDTEVIAHGYEEWGERVVHYLRGMFVFVLLDTRRESKLVIARDRIGIKPFYYTEHEGRLIFASEIKAIFSGFDVNREPDEESVYKFLMYRIHDTDKNTFFKNVKRLLPGHFMVIDDKSNFRIEKYWNPSFNENFTSDKSDKEYADEFRDIFTEAIDLHLIGDVPVGVSLSGGLDSSGITSIASKLYSEKNIGENHKLYAFSAIHPGETVNEEEYIDEVVRVTDVENIKIAPDLEKFWEELDIWTYFQEEPVISAAPYAYYVVMREARKYVTVLLSGQGGDELLAGYIPYFMSYWQTAMDQGYTKQALSELYSGKDLYLKYIFSKIDSSIRKKNLIVPNNYLNKPDKMKIPVFTNKRNLNERLFEDVTSTTTPCLLRYEDKNSMANSLESRVPFYDHVVVEYLLNLPIDQKIKKGWNRYIYRNAMKGLIPEKNRLRRSKIGFTNPESEWIERKRDKFVELFNSESFRSRSFWDADKVIEGFQAAIQGKIKGDILFFWRLFSVEMWLRTYVDSFNVVDTSKLVYFRD